MPLYSLVEAPLEGSFELIHRKCKLSVDGRFYRSIIRPTSGAVETENSLRFNELRSFRQRLRFSSSKPEAVGKAVSFRLINDSILSVESG